MAPPRWALVLLLLPLVNCLPLETRQPLPASLRESRNIKPRPCVSGAKTGVCMYAQQCNSLRGVSLGTCIDGFYFGSCCELKPNALPPVNPALHKNITIIATSTTSTTTEVPTSVSIESLVTKVETEDLPASLNQDTTQATEAQTPQVIRKEDSEEVKVGVVTSEASPIAQDEVKIEATTMGMDNEVPEVETAAVTVSTYDTSLDSYVQHQINTLVAEHDPSLKPVDDIDYIPITFPEEHSTSNDLETSHVPETTESDHNEETVVYTTDIIDALQTQVSGLEQIYGDLEVIDESSPSVTVTSLDIGDTKIDSVSNMSLREPTVPVKENITDISAVFEAQPTLIETPANVMDILSEISNIEYDAGEVQIQSLDTATEAEEIFKPSYQGLDDIEYIHEIMTAVTEKITKKPEFTVEFGTEEIMDLTTEEVQKVAPVYSFSSEIYSLSQENNDTMMTETQGNYSDSVSDIMMKDSQIDDEPKVMVEMTTQLVEEITNTQSLFDIYNIEITTNSTETDSDSEQRTENISVMTMDENETEVELPMTTSSQPENTVERDNTVTATESGSQTTQTEEPKLQEASNTEVPIEELTQGGAELNYTGSGALDEPNVIRLITTASSIEPFEEDMSATSESFIEESFETNHMLKEEPFITSSATPSTTPSTTPTTTPSTTPSTTP